VLLALPNFDNNGLALEMDSWADDTRAAKRRRLNIFNDNQTQAAAAQSYLSLDDTQAPFLESRRSSNDEATPTNRGLVACPTTTISHDGLSKIEQEPPECCYGMVRRKLDLLQRNSCETNN
jgi:hypothetical protein